MAELITAQITKESYLLNGDLEERATPFVGPVLIDMPFDEKLYLRTNSLKNPGSYQNYNLWSGNGVYFTNQLLESNGFLGNGVYRCEKYGTSSDFYYYAYGLAGTKITGEYVVFSTIMKSTNSSGVVNPFDIYLGRGSMPWTSGDYTSGTSLWTKNEYLGDGWWRLSACSYLPRALVTNAAHKEKFYFGVHALWATAGTYVYGTCPFAYEGTSLYAYPTGLFLQPTEAVMDTQGIKIEQATTNKLTIPNFYNTPLIWNGSIINTKLKHQTDFVYEITPSPTLGGGCSWVADNTVEIASSAGFTLSTWIKTTPDINNYPLPYIQGDWWNGSAWSAVDPIHSKLTSKIETYYDEMGNIISAPIANQWCRVVSRCINGGTGKIRLTKFYMLSNTFTLGKVYLAAPQYEYGGDYSNVATKFSTSPRIRCTQVGVAATPLIPPYTVSFKYRPSTRLASHVSQATSPRIFHIGGVDSNGSIGLAMSGNQLHFLLKDNTGASTNQTPGNYTFTSNTWDDVEHTYFINVIDARNFKIYIDSTYLGQVIWGVDVTTNMGTFIFPQGDGAIWGYGSASYRHLLLLNRSINADETGNIIASLSRRFDGPQNKDIGVLTTSMPVKETKDLLYVKETLAAPSASNLRALWNAGLSPLATNSPVLIDLSGNNNTGTTTNVTQTGSQLIFNGTSSLINFTEIDFSTDITILAKVKLVDLSVAANPIIFNRMTLLRLSNAGLLEWYPDTTGAAATYTIPLFSASKTYAIAVTQTGTTAKMFVDGDLVYSSTVAAKNNTSSGHFLGNWSTQYGKLALGEVRVYQRVLTASEIYSWTFPNKKVYAPAIGKFSIGTSPIWGYYTQANCTSDWAAGSSSINSESKYSYCIKRTANIVYPGSSTMWGGIVLTLPESAKVMGRTYKIRFKYRGQTTNASECYAAYDIANPAYGQGLSSHYITGGTIAADTNTKEWSYIEGTYTVSSRYQVGVPDGLTYDTYRQLKIGWGYASTGALGTRIFIDDIQIHDITDTSASFSVSSKGISVNQYSPGTNALTLIGTAAAQGDFDVYLAVTATLNGVNMNPAGTRGLTLLIWNEAGTILSNQAYDTYASDAARTSLASQLASISTNQYWGLVSYDACISNTTLNSQMTAMGATQFATYDWATLYRTPYAAFGQGTHCLKEDLRDNNSRYFATINVRY